MIEKILPGDKDEWLQMRTNYITSTEISCLYGANPYLTEFELWHRKKDKLIADNDNEFMSWGRELEPSIASKFAKDNNWKIEKEDHFYFDNEKKLGSSFDFIGVNGFSQEFILEIKNVGFRSFDEGWIVNGDEIEAPLHIEFQMQQQMALRGLDQAYIGALVSGNKGILLKREIKIDLIASIARKAAEFWKSIKEDTPPAPDYQKDAAFISKLYGYADPNKIINVDESSDIFRMAINYEVARRQEKLARDEKESIKAMLLEQIQDAEKVKGPNFSISAGMIGPKHIEYERKGYRDFKIYFRKEKK
jgi:putative phage-type endonuclease